MNNAFIPTPLHTEEAFELAHQQLLDLSGGEGFFSLLGRLTELPDDLRAATEYLNSWDCYRLTNPTTK